ncbi:MAG: hypothetical protein H0U92_13110 [Actinobacteria bacterium]|nr:hypothetical protein [Actinomycetota bacterium]
MLHEARRSLTVAEIVGRIEADGFTIGPNAHKVVADALRWEVRRGRARRVRRGVYGTGRLPRSSESKMRAALRRLRIEMTVYLSTGDGTDSPCPDAETNSLERGAIEGR